MMEYPWPGNIRELENAIEHAFVRCTGSEIRLEDLPVELREARPVFAPGASDPADAASSATVRPLHPVGRDERAIILAALRACGGNRSEAAERLGVSRTTLWRRMKELGIDVSQRRMLQDETHETGRVSPETHRETQ
jgi:DNA-binding NtrC family response regulator